MPFLKILFLGCICSQIPFLGVFGLDENEYYVIDSQKNFCGLFIKGTSQNPNWLPEGWESISLDPKLEKKFSANLGCSSGQSKICCQEMGYVFSSITIGQKTIGEGRFAAEFLAAKKIIQSESFSPGNYALKNPISRKELMKVIMNTSGKKIVDQCKRIFGDVSTDWGCKYIEGAFEYDFIEKNISFRPNENVTKVEALKLIFQARNIEKRYTTLYWQEDYISSAYYLGYIDEKFKDYNSFASREWIFQVLARTYSEYSYKK